MRDRPRPGLRARRSCCWTSRFAGIDPLAISDIREVIRYLKGRGIGVLITDHNVRETLDIIDRASIIHGGEVLFEGTPDEILTIRKCAASTWATGSARL